MAKTGDCAGYLTQSPFIWEGGYGIIRCGDDMNNPKQQHFVPKVYLQHFCTKQNKNQLYFYDKISKKTALTHIDNVAQEKDFYSDLSQEDKYYYEKYYSNYVEPLMGQLLNRIVSTATLCSEHTPLLTANDRHSLTKMLVYQILRTRNARNLMREKADSISEPFIAQLIKIPEIRKNKNLRSIVEKHRILDENTFKEIALPLAIDESRLTRYTELIDTMICTFYSNQTNDFFITSDNPVIIKRMTTQDIGLGTAGLGQLDCMIVYPITPRLAAVFCHNDFLFALSFREYENRKIPITQVEIVQTLNKWQLLQANRQVYSQTRFFL